MDVKQPPNLRSDFEVSARVTRPDTLPPTAAPPLKVQVKGFNTMEHRLLNGTVLISQRRQPRLELSNDENGQTADVVLIDASDAAAMQWAAQQPWLKHKVVIWVDAVAAGHGHIALRRPVQWTSLPIILARALEQTSSQPTDTAHTSPSTASVSVPSQRSVLVVDDSLAVRAFLRSLLEARGYTVTDADSAEAGIDATAAADYACILMDVLMPGIDGYEACRCIKARTRNKSGPPIVMLTSKSSPFDRIRGKMAGCDAYLTKPVDSTTLYEVVSRYIPALAPAPAPASAQAATAGVPRVWASGYAARGAA